MPGIEQLLSFQPDADSRLFGGRVRRSPYLQITILACLFLLNLLLISRNTNELIEFPYVMILIVPYFLLALKYPELGLAIFIIFHLTPLKGLTPAHTSFLSLSILIELCLGAALILHFLLSRKLPSYRDKLSLLLLLYIGFYVVAAIWRSSAPTQREGGWFKPLVVLMLTYIFMVGFINSWEKLIWVLRAFVLLSLFWFLASLIDILTYGFETIYLRVRTEIGFLQKWTQVDVLATTVLMFLPFLYFLMHQKQSKAWQSMSKLGFYLSPFTVFLTASRNGFVALVVVLALIFFQKKGSPKLWAFLLIMVMFILIAPSGYWQRISTIPQLDVESGLSLKISHLQRGLEIVRENPLFGIGLGKLKRAIHNTVLQVAVEVGLPAMLIFLGMIYLAIKELKRAERSISQNVHLAMFSRLPWMVIVSLVAYLIGGLTVSNNLMLPFFIILGLITALRNLTLEESREAKIIG